MHIGKFKLEATDGLARAGILQTAHGVIETPVFMPVGTKASVKSLDPSVVEDLGAQVILGNTYHLYLAPGDELIRDHDGLHNFMHWNKPILTDSGGFQVFSLGLGKKDRRHLTQSLSPLSGRGDYPIPSPLRGEGKGEETIPEARVTEDGVEFKSHRDGSKHFFSPEKSIDIQVNLGSDIMMAFDECAPHPSTPDYYRKAMERTHRWLERCINHKSVISTKPQAHGEIFKRSLDSARDDNLIRATNPLDQLLFGIVQGGMIRELREESARFVASKNLPGVAIGGVAVGESYEQRIEQVEWVMPHIPQSVPHYLMGIGTPLDLVEFVARGIDMFDCVLPTRLARNGAVWVIESTSVIPAPYLVRGKLPAGIHGSRRNGRDDKLVGKRIQLKNSQYKTDPQPLQQGCACSTCKRFSRAYIHHLFMENEPLGMQLTSVHNLYVLIDEMRQIRQAILNGTFSELRTQLNSIWGSGIL